MKKLTVSLSFFVRPMRRKSRSVAVEAVTRERGSMSAEVLRRKKRIRVRWFSLVRSWDSMSRRVSVLRAMRARRNMRRMSRIYRKGSVRERGEGKTTHLVVACACAGFQEDEPGLVIKVCSLRLASKVGVAELGCDVGGTGGDEQGQGEIQKQTWIL